MKKIIILMLMLVLATSIVSAVDLAIDDIRTDQTNPPAVNTLTSIIVDVSITNAHLTTDDSTILRVNFDNGEEIQEEITNLNNDGVYTFLYTTTYTESGNYVVEAEIGAVEGETNTNNNLDSLTIEVIEPIYSLEVNPIQTNVLTGTVKTVQTTIKNNGTFTVNNINIATTDLTKNNDGGFIAQQDILESNRISITPTSLVMLFAGSTATINFEIDVPENQNPGLYTGQIVVTHNEGETIVPIAVEIESASVYSINVENVEFGGLQGETVSTDLEVENTGNALIEDLIINISGFTSGNGDLFEGQVTINPESLTITPGSIESVEITAEIPENQEPETYFGTITLSKENTRFNSNNNKEDINEEILVTLNVLDEDNDDSEESFSVKDLEFGSETQARGVTINEVLEIKNNENRELTLNLESMINSIYEVSMQESVTLSPNESDNVEVTIFIPETQNSGRSELVGGIKLTDTQTGASRTAKTYLTIESMIETTKIVAEANGVSETLNEGFVFSSIKPNDEVTLKAYVKNLFTSSNNQNLEDIEVRLIASEDLDIDEKRTIDELKRSREDHVEFTFRIPEDAHHREEYDLNFTVEGTDENGAKHKHEYSIILRVTRDEHHIIIKDVSFSRDPIACGNVVSATVTIKNVGRNDERQSFISIYNRELGINQKTLVPIDVDVDKEHVFNINIPRSATPRSYDFEVKTYYDTDKESDSMIETLRILSCAATDDDYTTHPGDDYTVTEEATIIARPVEQKESFTDSPLYLIVLIGAAVIILTLMVLIIKKLA